MVVVQLKRFLLAEPVLAGRYLGVLHGSGDGVGESDWFEGALVEFLLVVLLLALLLLDLPGEVVEDE